MGRQSSPALLLVAGWLRSVAAHGAVTHPKPRQAIDGSLAPWNGSVPDPVPFDTPNWCAHESAVSTDWRNLSGSNGQACFWFSNGCDIGCDKCDGDTGQKIPCCDTKFLYAGNGTVPSWGGEGIVPDPTWLATFDREKVRPAHVKFPDRKPTICDPKLRTINTNAECGAADDFWYYTPWRSPGVAPVIDSCGTAGGRLPGQGQGSAGASYVETINAKVGDSGSKLPPLPTGTVWKAGSDVEVAWALKAWHGGGYAYRLCEAGRELDEDCFQKTHLNFTGNSSLRWGGVGGERQYFNSTAKGWEVSVGTVPKSSMWRKIPIPRTVNEWNMYGASFEPVCEESEECKSSHDKAPKEGVCKCSGDWNDMVEIVDKVHIPATLAPGKYVLGWRWDCEESTQVWSSCSDLTIV